jgi:aromatic-L-amino-acid decarboxylase
MSLESLRQACAAPLPEPGAEEIEQAIRSVAEFLRADFFGLPASSVGQTASRAQMESLLRQAAPEEGAPFANVLQDLKDKVVPFSLRPNHPRFLAFVPSAPTFTSILGDWLCAGLNFFAGVWKEAPGAAQVEILVLDWFKTFLGYPDEAGGVLTGGGSEANLIALVTAREKIPASARSRLRAYVSGQRHWSIDRAFMIMGLVSDHVRAIGTDSLGRMNPQLLDEAVREDQRQGRAPLLVVANAGTTNTGAVDPLYDIADVCRRHGLWFHVDAAYGWPAVLSETQRPHLQGIDQADSLTLDPHKWFAQPFEAGCVLVREGGRLTKTFQMRPEYMQDVEPRADEVNFCDQGLALTRRFRALKIWLSIKVLGLSWFRRLVDHCCGLAVYAEEALRARPCFEIVTPASLSIVCFRYVPLEGRRSVEELNALNLDLCEKLRETGRAFLSTTRLQEVVCLRLCFVNYRTTAADVDEIVELLERLGGELSKTFSPGS